MQPISSRRKGAKWALPSIGTPGQENFTYAVSFVCGILLCRLLLRQQIIMEALTISTEVMHVQAGWLYGATTVRRERFSVLRWLLCFVLGTVLCVAFCGRLTQGIIRIADYFMGSARSARLWIVLWEWGRITKTAAAYVVRAGFLSRKLSAAYDHTILHQCTRYVWEQFVGRQKATKKLSLSEFSSACFDWLKLSLAFLAFFIVIFTFFHFLISDVVWYLFGFDAAFVHEMPCAKRRIQFRDWPPFSLTRQNSKSETKTSGIRIKFLFSRLYLSVELADGGYSR